MRLEAEVENLRRKDYKRCSRCWWFDFESETICLNTAYTMDEIGGYITGISFKLCKHQSFKQFKTSSKSR